MEFLRLAKYAIDLTGREFGRLSVLGPVERRLYADGMTLVVWLCKCGCGRLTKATGKTLRNGSTTSCGCRHAEMRAQGMSRRHGHASHKSKVTGEYGTWVSMRKRCLNPAHAQYLAYGGRGITICDRWNDFETFYADMGAKPSPKHSLDRIDNNGNYEPGNCRWATAKEQQNNKRDNLVVCAFGKKQTCSEWAREYGLNRAALSQRLRAGWDVERALTTPSRWKERRTP
jgi:hypothetical protein